MLNQSEQMSDQELKGILTSARTIAVVGAKDALGQPVDRVGRYLIQAGYRVVPVHPARKEVWGLETYPALADIPFAIDIVDLFRAAQYCPGHAEECVRLESKPTLFFMQLGISSPEAANVCSRAGIKSVWDRCLMVEHNRLMGGGA